MLKMANESVEFFIFMFFNNVRMFIKQRNINVLIKSVKISGYFYGICHSCEP